MTTDTRKLQNRIAELEEEVRQLREALRPTDRLPKHWRLTGQEEALVLALFARNGAMRYEAIGRAMAWRDEVASVEHIQVTVSKIRKKVPGIRIVNLWGVGYGLDDHSRGLVGMALNRHKLLTHRKEAA